MAVGGQKRESLNGLLDTMSRGAKKQSSLFFRLLCIRCKFSDVIQGKIPAQDIQYHVQRVGGDRLVVFQSLDLRPADTVAGIKAVLADAVFL